ncbi:MAG: hypothetical protein K2I49_02765, partial [Ureaplasma sp.]|nr:hypothetical protein [Ureaplasma sp.]
DIKSITYLNNALNITLNPPTNFNKYIAEDNKNISFSNNTFIIKNLSFVTNINFVKLDKLFDLFQNQISNNKYTIEQFKEWIANNTNINGDVANNLYISENDTINSDLVESVKFNGVDSVIVSLKKSSLINYSIGKNDDISLVDNNIIITNFIYYSVTNVVNLSAVFDTIQAIINTNKFSIDDFEGYVKAADTNAVLKDEIAKSLNLQNSTITIANIDTVEFKNNSVEITLIPGENEKYNFEDYTNATYDDNKITITNFDFYTIINFDKPNLIHQAIQNRIDDSQMSFDDFASDITNNQPLIKNIIADNLSTNLGNILVDRIGKVSLINNNLTIQINPLDYTKYAMSNDNNVSLNDNIITITNLKYYLSLIHLWRCRRYYALR